MLATQHKLCILYVCPTGNLFAKPIFPVSRNFGSPGLKDITFGEPLELVQWLLI